MSTYKCSECDFISVYKGNTKKHIQDFCKDAHIVPNIVMISCDVCGKQCETKKLMDSHKKNCVKKRVEVINEDVDGELKDMYQRLAKLVASNYQETNNLKEKFEKLEKSHAALQKENETIKKQLEKLRSKNEEEEQDIKEVNKEEGNNCSFFKEIKIIPVSRQQVKNILEEAKCEDDHVDVTIEGQRSIVLEADISEQEYIEVGTQKYYYKKREKNNLCASKLKIIFKKYCGAAADCEINGCYYCGDHVNKI